MTDFLNQIDQLWIEYGLSSILNSQQKKGKQLNYLVPCFDKHSFMCVFIIPEKSDDEIEIDDLKEINTDLEKLFKQIEAYSKPTTNLILDYLQYIQQYDHLVQSYGNTYSIFYYKVAFEEVTAGLVNLYLKSIMLLYFAIFKM